MRWSFTAAILAAAFAAGCSTVKQTQIISNEMVRVPVAELNGLSRAELETRLRLAPASRVPVMEARLEGGDVATQVLGWRLTKDTPCPRSVARPQLMFQQGGVSLAVPEFTFVSDHVTAVTHRPTRSDGIPGEQEIVVTCSERKASTKDQVRDVMGIAIFAPILLPVAGAITLTSAATADDINGALAKLPLGAEAPGGLDAYLAKLPNGAVLKAREGETAQVDFHFHQRKDVPESQYGTPDASVYFVDGRVTKLVSAKDCALTKDRAFNCDRGYP
ncbi:MAG TPA: hypothetical protein VGO52_22025 [Hyphomonadaceae bacterium]|jgi:hypothetical protein|nr:hypothetical protein [Hyphomonadaceae bacterium]